MSHGFSPVGEAQIVFSVFQGYDKKRYSFTLQSPAPKQGGGGVQTSTFWVLDPSIGAHWQRPAIVCVSMCVLAALTYSQTWASVTYHNKHSLAELKAFGPKNTECSPLDQACRRFLVWRLTANKHWVLAARRRNSFVGKNARTGKDQRYENRVKMTAGPPGLQQVPFGAARLHATRDRGMDRVTGVLPLPILHVVSVLRIE